jgi:G:T-mismatch repair DNA endonuclease (very short patch repair protein)
MCYYMRIDFLLRCRFWNRCKGVLVTDSVIGGTVRYHLTKCTFPGRIDNMYITGNVEIIIHGCIRYHHEAPQMGCIEGESRWY